MVPVVSYLFQVRNNIYDNFDKPTEQRVQEVHLLGHYNDRPSETLMFLTFLCNVPTGINTCQF